MAHGIRGSDDGAAIHSGIGALGRCVFNLIQNGQGGGDILESQDFALHRSPVSKGEGWVIAQIMQPPLCMCRRGGRDAGRLRRPMPEAALHQRAIDEDIR